MKVPNHIAFIMDGNGRWAKKRALPRTVGHKAGTENLKKILRYCRDIGVKETTFYAFSTENWKRSEQEVSALMKLLLQYLKSNIKELHEEDVCFRTVGDISVLHPVIREAIAESEALTISNTGIRFNVAINYGGRDEIRRMIQRLIGRAMQGKIISSDITDEYILQSLDLTSEPDLLIRTGGEKRISNYLLWQMAYTEYIFTDDLWPDFGPDDIDRCLKEYTLRDRRYGGINEN